MKRNMFMIASLLILVGMGAVTVSCKKEKTASSRKAELITENFNEKTGDDEDPIIRVRVKKKNTFLPVDSANVQTYVYGTNVRFNSGYTDESGKYDRQVPANTYYFKVYAPGNSIPYVTDTLHVTADVTTTILVD